MSYQHMFYGLDLERLQSLYGSGDEDLLAEILQSQVEPLQDNDAFFESQIEDGTCPDSATALRQIVAGASGPDKSSAAMFGYVLKILCEHLGQRIGMDVCAVRDHPFQSQLVSSGPPIPIPYDTSDFPEIGFLALSDIPGEIQRLDAAPKRAKRSVPLTLLGILTRGLVGRQMSAEEAAEDMAAYRDTLQEAMDKGLSLVSFRH